MARLLFLQNLEYEYLGPMYISSMIKQHGHDCQLAIGETIEDLSPVIDRFSPDLVGFSVMTGSHIWAKQMADKLKQEYNIKCIFGGAHPTFFPDYIKEKSVDLLVRGEGEEAMVEIMNCIDKGVSFDDIPNLCSKKNGKIIYNDLRALRSDLDDYPMPDRHLYDVLEYRLDRSVRNVITSRGCPFHCTFCFEDTLRELYYGKGKYVRIRHFEKIIEECKKLKDESNIRLIYFADDVFGMSKKWLYEFLPIYKKEIGLEFICLVRADIVASDEEYAYRLAEGGCRSVFFGIESGNEELRNHVLKKKLTDEEIIKAADLLHKAGIKFRTYNIMGIPDETLLDAFSTVELNIKIKTDYPWCSVFSPFPGTELADYAIKKNILSDQFEYDHLSKSFFITSEINLPSINQIINLQKFFQTVVLWPWLFPLVKMLIRIRPNRLYTWWFGLIYFFIYVKSENRNFWATLRFAIKNFKHVLLKE